MYSQTQNNTYTKINLSTVEWAQWDKTQSKELLVLFICVCIALCTIVAHSIAQTDLIIFPLTLQTITIALMMCLLNPEYLSDVIIDMRVVSVFVCVFVCIVARTSYQRTLRWQHRRSSSTMWCQSMVNDGVTLSSSDPLSAFVVRAASCC